MSFHFKKFVLNVVLGVFASLAFVHSASADFVTSIDLGTEDSQLGFLELSCKDQLQSQAKPQIEFFGMQANVGKNGLVRFSQTHNIVSARLMSRNNERIFSNTPDQLAIDFANDWLELDPSSLYISEYTPLLSIQWDNRSEFFAGDDFLTRGEFGSGAIAKAQEVLLGDVRQLIFVDRSFSGDFNPSKEDPTRTASLPSQPKQPDSAKVK